jgi:hypothetical protein
MSKALSAVFGVLVVAASAFGTPPQLEIPAELKPAGQYVRLTPKTDAASVLYVGLSGIDPFPSEELKDPRRFLLDVRGLPAGRYAFAAVAASKDGDQIRADFVVIVGTPPPPVPPGPTPPIPPGPVPPTPPEPAPPIAGDGFKVLIVYEKQEQQKLTAGQLNTIFGQKFRDYMVAKNGQYLILDKDNTAANQPKEWQDAMRRPRAAHPWVLISNGKTGFEGPLPTHEEEINLLLRKYGGQ